jgi:hypothetical protein
MTPVKPDSGEIFAAGANLFRRGDAVKTPTIPVLIG